MGRRLALLIATYEHEDPGLRELTAPAADAEALAAVLRDPTIAGFDVTMLINQPHYHVGEAIAELYRDRRRDDLTLLYFTGHGLKDDDGRLYLATTNTRRDSLLFTSLPAEQIDYAVEACASRQKILILDCCYSGAFPVRGVKGDPAVHATERFQGRGRTILTASDSLQYSFEGNPIGDTTQSVFTRHLVQGIREGSADLDGDGDITVDELYSYVHDRVIAEKPQQRPKKQDNVEGRIVLARNINWALPVYLRNSLNSPIATDRLGAMEGLLHLHRIGNDTVRAHVIAELERLADDDSRAVSTTAAAHLLALGKEKIQPEPAPRHVDVNDPHAPAPLDAPPDETKPTPPEPPTPVQRPDGGAIQSGARPSTLPPAEQPAMELSGPGEPSAPAAEASDPQQSATSDDSDSANNSLLPRLSCACLAVTFFSWALILDEPELVFMAWGVAGASCLGLACVLIERRRNRRWVIAIALSFTHSAIYGIVAVVRNELAQKSAGVYLTAALVSLGAFTINGGVLPLLGAGPLVELPRQRLFYLWTGGAGAGFAIAYVVGQSYVGYILFDALLLVMAGVALSVAAWSPRRHVEPAGK